MLSSKMSLFLDSLFCFIDFYVYLSSNSIVFHYLIYVVFFLTNILFIYLWQTRGGWADTQAEGEAGSMQGAWRGTQSQVSRITPWAEGDAKPVSHQGCPELINLIEAYLFHCFHNKVIIYITNVINISQFWIIFMFFII